MSGCLTEHNSGTGQCVQVVFSQHHQAGCHLIQWRILSWEIWSSTPMRRLRATQLTPTWTRTFSLHGVRDTTKRASGSRSLSLRLSTGRVSRYQETHSLEPMSHSSKLNLALKMAPMRRWILLLQLEIMTSRVSRPHKPLWLTDLGLISLNSCTLLAI